MNGHAADQVGYQPGGVHFVHPSPHLDGAANPYLVRNQLAIQNIRPAFRVVHNVLQQFMNAHDIDVKLLVHQVYESVVFLARTSCPDDIVKQ